MNDKIKDRKIVQDGKGHMLLGLAFMVARKKRTSRHLHGNRRRRTTKKDGE